MLACPYSCSDGVTVREEERESVRNLQSTYVHTVSQCALRQAALVADSRVLITRGLWISMPAVSHVLQDTTE